MTIFAFILTLLILVGIHEWAHFAVARAFNVKIERFSLGFGPALIRWRGKKDATEYRLGCIPLGGYVAMLGETKDKTLSEEEYPRSFMAQAPWKRFLIAFAGPASNLIFAWLAFSALYLYGVEGLRPEIVRVAPHSVATAADLRLHDRFTRINGEAVFLDVDAQRLLVANMYHNIDIELERDGKTIKLDLDLREVKAGDEFKLTEALGFALRGEWLPAVIAEVLPDSAAASMGLQEDDEITHLNGQDVDLIRFFENMPAVGEAFTLGVLRAGEALQLSGIMGEFEGRPRLGIRWYRPDLNEFFTFERYPLLQALQRGYDKMWGNVKMMYQMMGRMLNQRASIDNLGGPLTLGDLAGKTFRLGWAVFLNFLGILSLSLAALNLLPIPALDGGHMLLYTLEMIRGKALSERSMKYLLYAGAALLYAFMMLVISRDVWKYWPW